MTTHRFSNVVTLLQGGNMMIGMKIFKIVHQTINILWRLNYYSKTSLAIQKQTTIEDITVSYSLMEIMNDKDSFQTIFHIISIWN